MTMRKEYDFSKMKSRKNPYAKALKKQVTLRLGVDVIEYFKLPGRLFQVGEILEQQKRLYDDLGVSPPASLRVGGNQGCIVSK